MYWTVEKSGRPEKKEEISGVSRKKSKKLGGIAKEILAFQDRIWYTSYSKMCWL